MRYGPGAHRHRPAVVLAFGVMAYRLTGEEVAQENITVGLLALS